MAATLAGRADTISTDLEKYVTVDISDLSPQGNMDFDLTFTLTDVGINNVNGLLGQPASGNAPVMLCMTDSDGHTYGVGLLGAKSRSDLSWTRLSFNLCSGYGIDEQVTPDTSRTRAVYRTVKTGIGNEVVYPIIGKSTKTVEKKEYEELGDMKKVCLTLTCREKVLNLLAKVTYEKSDEEFTFTHPTSMNCELTDFTTLSINTAFVALEDIDLSMPSTAPEPATATLGLLALAGLAKRRRRA